MKRNISIAILFYFILSFTQAQIPAVVAGATGSISFTYQNNVENYPIVRTNNNRLWTQKNLGATRVAQSVDDTLSYGHYFQWGRWDDGHQIPTSNTVLASTLNPNNPLGLSGGNSNYVTTTGAQVKWWENSSTTDTWTAANPNLVTATNGCDPCKAIGPEWRLPTGQEYLKMLQSENIHVPTDGFTSNLKFSFAGFRDDAQITLKNIYGYFWASNNGTNKGTGGYMHLYHDPTQPTSKPGVWYTFTRHAGFSIRCIRNCQDIIVNIKDSICEGKKYMIGDKEFTTTGQYTEKLWAFYGCDSIVSVDLSVTPAPEIVLDTAICANQTIQYNGITFTAPATYSYTSQTNEGCAVKNYLHLTVAPNLLDLGSDTTLCMGEELKIQLPTYLQNPQWNDGSHTYEKIITENGLYSVSGEICNIYVQDTLQVDFAKIKKVNLPNVFTPNQDGQNDALQAIFTEPNLDLKNFQLTVYNRWGNIVYQTHDQNFSWNGNINNAPAAEGIYYYIIDVFNGCQNQEKGYFYIFR